MDMEDSIIVKLSKPIDYGKDGENRETEFVEIRCPSKGTSSQRRYFGELTGLFSSVMLAQSRNYEKNDTSHSDPVEVGGDFKFEPKQMLILISGHLKEDFPVAVDRFYSHAEKYCFLGGEEPLKSGVVERMETKDLYNIFAAFIANFIAPSLL